MRATWPWVFGALCVAALGVNVAATIMMLGEQTNECDNIAGTCLRERQYTAIMLFQGGAVAAATVAAAGLFFVATGRRLRVALVVTVLLAAAFGVAVLAVDPVEHLGNRWTGWLGG